MDNNLFKRYPELTTAVSKVRTKMIKLRKEKLCAYGETCAPRPADYVEDDPTIGKVYDNYLSLINPENDIVDGMISNIIKGFPAISEDELAPLTPENVWLWGGPTPYWAGSMQDDCVVKGADYFGANNVVYVYGPTDDKMLSMLSKYKKVLCQVNENCRTPGALAGTPEENAELLSKLSLKYPNITGAMLDDVANGYFRKIDNEKFVAIKKSLTKYNKDLKMYGVVYAHELISHDCSPLNDCLDVVNLWFWHKDEILYFDDFYKCFREQFPTTKLICGVFLREYGSSDVGNTPELLRFHIQKIQQLIKKGEAEGMIILGDREIKLWPESAKAVKEYVGKYF